MMEIPRILLLETIHEDAHSLLSEQCHITTGYESIPPSGDFQAIITRGKGRVTAEMMDNFPGLRVIARCGVGLDNIDVNAATARNIPVINAPGINTHTVAEHTLSLMLLLVRNMFNSVLAVKEDNWGFRNHAQTDELAGKKLGIVGMGNIGRKVAEMASVFGMEIYFYDPFVEKSPFHKLALDALLSSADIISIHLPLNESTRGLIDRQKLDTMKPSAFLVNTSRGEIIDHRALEDALSKGKLAGFASDVLPEEPPPVGYSLLKRENVLITPHSASLTATTYRQMCLTTVINVIGLLTRQSFDIRAVFNRNELPGYQ